MNPKSALSFYKFHQIIQPCLTVTQAKFYRSLFQHAYPESEVPEESICRWCQKQACVAMRILKPAAAAPEQNYEPYRSILADFIKAKQLLCPTDLVSSIREAIQKDLSLEKKRLPKAEHELLAFALTEALKNDYIEKTVSIQPLFLEKLKKADSRCRQADIPLNIPHILDILLNEPYSLLFETLNGLKPSLGSNYQKAMHLYADSLQHSGHYENWSVSDCEFLFYAKKKAFGDRKKIADDFDILRGLLLTDSNTLSDMLQFTGGKDRFIKAMSETAHSAHHTTKVPIHISDITDIILEEQQ